MSFKVPNIGDPGTGERFGADDLEKINRILNGENLGLSININNDWKFRTQKLILRDFGNSNNIRIATSPESANWTITIPTLDGNREPVFTDLPQTLSNKIIAGLKRAIVNETTTPLPLTSSYEIVEIDATAGAKVVSLPPVSTSKGLSFLIQKVDSSSNTVTIDPDGSETINGALTIALNSQYETIQVWCNEVEWFANGVLRDNVVTADKIANNAVTTTKINASAVTNAKINDVAWAKISGVPDAATGSKGIAQFATDGEIASLKAIQSNDSRLVRSDYENFKNGIRQFGFFDPRDGANGTYMFRTIIGAVFAGSHNQEVDNTLGMYRYYETGSSSGNTSGRAISTAAFKRFLKPRFCCIFRANSASNFGLYIGLASVNDGTFISATTPLNAMSGFLIGMRPGDTNFSTFNNDGSGNATVTAISGKTKSNDVIRIEIWSDGTNYYWTFKDSSTLASGGPISTKIPASTTDQYAVWGGITNTNSAMRFLIYKMFGDIDIPNYTP